ncbi:MAG TPA: DUF3291 domain-containing protein [Pseudomonadales bacterium]|nr:DUF3291 domain-containing protein [Pseudomonadales bacterium]
MSSQHLAQFNVATARGDPDDPVMAGFVARLDEINGLADRAPGFVWRLQDANGTSTSFRVDADERVLPNLTVWTAIEPFRDFVYRSVHADMVRAGRSWFLPKTRPQIVLWWIPAGTLPTLEDGVARLDRLRAEGPTREAFTLARPHPVPD